MIKRTVIHPYWNSDGRAWWAIKVNDEYVWTNKVKYGSACARARQMIKQGWTKKVEVDRRIIGLGYPDIFTPACTYEWVED